MKVVTPQAFIIGDTQVDTDGLAAMLAAIGVPEWTTDAETGTELLIETAGKLCYMSFDTSLNKNLTRTGTRNNFDYIQQGLIGVGHGSVLEHGSVNIAFIDVSRVFTHELVRHRPGAAYSQTSGRYVRTDDLAFWLPSCITEDPNLEYEFRLAITQQEASIARMTEISGINNMTTQADFAKKKVLTSAFRRIIGNGIANNITATYNHRALRYLSVARTSRHAEEEIRLGFNSLFGQLAKRYPSIYADAEYVNIDGYDEITFKNAKV